MKRFLVNISVILFVSTMILVNLTLYDIRKLKEVDFFFGEDIHIIAYGPSTFTCAFVDNRISAFLDFSRNGSDYRLLMPLLPKILDDNPQLDTVWINHGRFQFFFIDNQQISGDHNFFRENLPFLLYDRNFIPWKHLYSSMNFYGALLNPNIINFIFNDRQQPQAYNFVGQTKVERNNLFRDDADWSILWYENKIKRADELNYSKDWIMAHCSMTHNMINYGIDICKKHGVVPVLFFTPLYEYNRWCPIEGFCEYMSDLDPNLLIADYEDFEFPDDSFYGDVHHLNPKGAEYFTSYIATNGLKVERLEDWLKRKTGNNNENKEVANRTETR